MRNWYAEAVGIVSAPRSDWAEIALEIAKRNPSVFVRAVEAVESRKQVAYNPWESEFQSLVSGDGDIKSMVAAIKLYREKTGASLKEAKSAYDKARSELLQNQPKPKKRCKIMGGEDHAK